MNAKKCDRCGTFYQPENWKDGDVVIKTKRKIISSVTDLIFSEFNFDEVGIDLCPGCTAFIKDWLTKKEN